MKPWGPVGPVAPVKPVVPLNPWGPVKPWGPVGPVAPVKPVVPLNPWRPVGPVNPPPPPPLPVAPVFAKNLDVKSGTIASYDVLYKDTHRGTLFIPNSDKINDWLPVGPPPLPLLSK